jgi:hypothetical protein
MSGLEKIDLTFSFNPFYFFLFLLVAVSYSIYIYRFTVPPVSSSKKIILISLRILSLILLLFIVFEPILTLTKNIILEPVSFVFVDNSRSILIKDGTNREENIKEFLKRLDQIGLENNLNVYTFGTRVKKADPFNNNEKYSLSGINFSEGSSNFSNIFSSIKNSTEDSEEGERNISSIIIISDGVITEGSSPVYAAEKLSLPVFTIGVGDTTRRNDIEIKNIIFNEFVYSETPTLINLSLQNTGFTGQNIFISLYEDEKLLEQKGITLGEEGVENINFNYIPRTSGEKKITVRTTELKGEFTFSNNKKTVFLNILSNKINVLLIAGSPSADLAFIKNLLEEDKNLSVNSLTYIVANKFIEKSNPDKLIDSSNVIFLIGFPSKEIPNAFITKIKNQLSEKNKPFFFVLSDGTDFTKLRMLQTELPFIAGQTARDWIEVQPVVEPGEKNNPLLQNNAQNNLSAWDNLPPVYQYYTGLQAKPESNVLAKIKVNNNIVNKPLIITSRLGSRSSIAVLAKDIWRWKLQTAPKDLDLFDRFIHNGVKWLNTSEEQKQVSIKTTKKIYSIGEPIEFTGQVYDQTFNPVFDAEVRVNINQVKESEIVLNSIGSGLYEGTFQITKPGDYNFSGSAAIEGKTIGTDKGTFSIGEADLEMMNPRMDYEFLSALANSTNGKFFFAPDYKELLDILREMKNKPASRKILTNEITLWSNEWLMCIVILLFGIEWFLRKRAGML